MARALDPPIPAPASLADAAMLLRQAREATALRENLRRRKQQVRARQQPDAANAAADRLPADPPGLPD